ncbi:MAG: phosphoenolpyruvate--protein phosphotransferase [Proteobacteria bacterium]|nr:phosphoenolpyruvate--protein phosphotransferase [Pseudomonadota bacterium]
MKNVLLELTRIVQAVALLNSPQEQVKTIVDSISQVLRQDVCSLFRIDDEGKAVLLASHGLIADDYASLPAGQGLVGLVVRSKRPLNLANAAIHPDYYDLQNSNERQFKSFCGVPLVRSGKVIGVLVVQSKLARQLSDAREAFLVTLGSQLTMIVDDIPSHAQQPVASNKSISGVIGAPGIAVGKTQLCVGMSVQNAPDGVCDDPAAEIRSLHKLLLATRKSIEMDKQLLGQEIPENVATIFDSYAKFLADSSYINKIELEIRAGHWLPGALRITTLYFANIFKAMDDPYLKARHEDLEHLGNKLLEVWSGKRGKISANYSEQDSIILVGMQVSVSDIASIPPAQLAGIVCFEGSSLSHSAVLAHALGIPALMGVKEIKDLQSGEVVVVDGYSGQLILRPAKAVLSEYWQIFRRDKRHRKTLQALRDKEAITTDGTRVVLMVNTGLLADITPGLKNGAEGVGLYRTEIPFMQHSSFPSEGEQIEFYSEVLSAYQDKPVYMRTLDIGGDKQLPYFPILHEENPALGWRGIRLTLDVIQLLVTQVRAMIRAAGKRGNLYITLPMISSLDEILKFNELLDNVCKELDSEGYEFTRPKLGIMVEVPAAISQIENFREHIDFLSIGSNDLSQYLLAMDRNNARVANRYDHVHPAVLHEINRIVRTASRCELPVSLCGEMGSDPVAVVLLMGMGVRQISMSSAMLPDIKSMIRMLKISRAKSLCKRAMKLASAQQIRELVEPELRKIGYLES